MRGSSVEESMMECLKHIATAKNRRVPVSRRGIVLNQTMLSKLVICMSVKYMISVSERERYYIRGFVYGEKLLKAERIGDGRFRLELVDLERAPEYVRKMYRILFPDTAVEIHRRMEIPLYAASRIFYGGRVPALNPVFDVCDGRYGVARIDEGTWVVGVRDRAGWVLEKASPEKTIAVLSRIRSRTGAETGSLTPDVLARHPQ